MGETRRRLVSRQPGAGRFLSHLAALLCWMASAFAFEALAADPTILTDVVVDGSATNQTIRFDLTRQADARVLLLRHPDRIALDFVDVLPASEPKGDGDAPLIEDLRHGATSATRYRYIVTPSTPVEARLTTSALGTGGTRYVVSLTPSAGETVIAGPQAVAASEIERTLAPELDEGRTVTVVLDPGHGGDDHGAVSAAGVMEKDINLDAAKAMRAALLGHHGIEVVMTRDDDSFVALADRTRIAADAGADLMISIHADSIRYKTLRGATIYTLSDRASDALSRELAERENAADRFAGESLRAEAPEVFDILVDLTRRETVSHSEHFAGVLLTALQRGNVRMIKNPKRSASFLVLKAPDVPSLLLELGFLSNAEDAKLLESERWREEIGQIVAGTIVDFYGLEKKDDTDRTARRQ